MTAVPAPAPTLTVGKAPAGIPMPVYGAFDLFEQGDRRQRRLRIAGGDVAHLRGLFERISWGVEPSTMDQYRPYILNYWAVTTGAGRDPFRLEALRDWIYALAYPRLRYLRQRTLGVAELPPRQQPGLGRSSLTVAAAAITQVWAVSGHASPDDDASWRHWWRGLRRQLRQPLARKAGILRDDLVHMIQGCREEANRPLGLRNEALLLLGWSAALRARELARVEVEHLQNRQGTWFLHLPETKTIKDGDGALVPLYPSRDPARDPLVAVQRWRRHAGIESGPLFRAVSKAGKVIGAKPLSTQAVAKVITRYTLKDNVSPHSLRIGYITQARADGHENWRIQIVSCHATTQMIDTYTRPDDAHREGPGALL